MNDRPSRATDAIAVSPATVTDRTAHLVLGLEPRSFRVLVASCGVRHVRVGRRLLARVDDILAALDAMAVEQGTGGAGEAPAPDGPETASSEASEGEPQWLVDALETIRAGEVLYVRAKQWLASNGLGASDKITDPDLRRRVRQMESRDRRRVAIDRDRARQGLPPRRWRQA
jgi:hypothetical protein